MHAGGRYLIGFAAFLVIVFAAVGGFSRLVDPFDIYGAPGYAGINLERHPVRASHERDLRLLQMPAGTRSIILGSSHVQSLVPQALPQPGFLFKIASLSDREASFYLRALAERGEFDTLVIEQSFVSSFARNAESYNIEPELVRLPAMLVRPYLTLKMMFSWYAVEKAVETIRSNWTLVRPANAQAVRMLSDSVEREIRGWLGLTQQTLGNYAIDPDRVEGFVAALRAVPARRKLVVIMPFHVSLIEAMVQARQFQSFELWRGTMKRIAEAAGAEFIDFSGYNPFTSELGVPEKGAFRYFNDASHPSAVLGAALSDCLAKSSCEYLRSQQQGLSLENQRLRFVTERPGFPAHIHALLTEDHQPQSTVPQAPRKLIKPKRIIASSSHPAPRLDAAELSEDVPQSTWHAAQPVTYPQTLEFEYAEPVRVSGFLMLPQPPYYDRAPGSFDIEISADGVNYVKVATVDAIFKSALPRTWAIPGSPTIRKARIVIKAASGAFILTLYRAGFYE